MVPGALSFTCAFVKTPPVGENAGAPVVRALALVGFGPLASRGCAQSVSTKSAVNRDRVAISVLDGFPQTECSTEIDLSISLFCHCDATHLLPAGQRARGEGARHRHSSAANAR